MSTREKLIAEADYSSASALVIFEAMAEETSVSPLRHGRWPGSGLARIDLLEVIRVAGEGAWNNGREA
jgi:hypothetical protein